MSTKSPDHCGMSVSTSVRKQATSRLRSIRGHVEGILRMLEHEDVYCVDVLKQLSAVEGALAKTGDIVLRGHLKHHVATAAQRGDTDAMVEELMDLLKYR